MCDQQLIDTLEAQGIITQKDTKKLIMRSSVSDLLKKLQEEWTSDSVLESGGHYLADHELADIYFIYDTHVYDASTALDEAISILVK